MVSFEFRRNIGGLDNNKLTHVETKSSFSTDISVCNDNDASNVKDKIDFDDCELGDASSDFSDSSAYEDLKDIDPSNFRLSPQHTISPKRDIDTTEDFQSIASPNSAERVCSEDFDQSYNIEKHADEQFLECEAIQNQDESLSMDIISPQLERLTENDLRIDTIDKDTTRTLPTDEDDFTEYTNVLSSIIELPHVSKDKEDNENLPEDNHNAITKNIYGRLCSTPLDTSQVIVNPAVEGFPVENVRDSVSSFRKSTEPNRTENTLIRTDTDICAIVDINSNKEDYENTIKIYKDLLGEELIRSSELNYEKLEQQSISDRLYQYISKVISDTPTSHSTNHEFKSPESNILEETEANVIVEPAMLDPKATETMDSDHVPSVENSDNQQDVYYLKGDNMESIPFQNAPDDVSDNNTFRSAEEGMEIMLESSNSNEEEWDISRGMISENSASLVNGILRSIKVIVGSNLFNNTEHPLQNPTSSLNASYSPVYDETKKLMQDFTEKLKRINSLKREFNEFCFKNANENVLVERNRLSYCLLASNSNKLTSIISQYRKLTELQNNMIAAKRNNILKMRKKIAESICKRQLFRKIQPKVEFLESLKYNLSSIYKSTGIKIIPIIDQNVFLKTTFVVSFNNNSDMRFSSDTYTNPWLNGTILKTKRLQKLLSLDNGERKNPDLGVNAIIYIKSPNHTSSRESSIDSMFQNTHSSKFSSSGITTESSLFASHRTLVDNSPCVVSKKGLNEDNLHSIITPRNKNSIHSNSETLRSSQTKQSTNVTEDTTLEDFVPREVNWDENIDILRLKHDLRVTLYTLKPQHHYGFNVWYEFNSVLLNMFNKFLKSAIGTLLGELEENPNLFQLLKHFVRITSNLAARIRIISRELYHWVAATNAHSFQYDGNEFKIRSMISSDGSKPCLWCDFGINMNNIHTRKTILESVNEIKVQLVHNRYKDTIVDDINRSLKSNTRHNHNDLCTFVRNTCKLNGYVTV